MRNFFYLLLLGAILATLALITRSGIFWRNDPRDRPINSAMREALDKKNPQLSTADEMYLAEHYHNANKRPSGLRWVVRAPGSGADTPQIGSEVIAHYDGRLLDGTSFDSSYRRGTPFVFRVGTGAVIKGWDEAFLSMKRGEKRTLIIPYWLGYGEKGSPPKIPGKATLVFEVELIDWR
ncbi:MAG: FKBP-type peptidyl-prolyl cis-trans isomerase [Verrucomicrobia bacterium]|nr:FKBP-type peptidyl-prolyl cis-trans isomerase [Verrucomicrobiota bacterium]